MNNGLKLYKLCYTWFNGQILQGVIVYNQFISFHYFLSSRSNNIKKRNSFKLGHFRVEARKTEFHSIFTFFLQGKILSKNYP